jgi:hypothetical protein
MELQEQQVLWEGEGVPAEEDPALANKHVINDTI